MGENIHQQWNMNIGNRCTFQLSYHSCSSGQGENFKILALLLKPRLSHASLFQVVRTRNRRRSDLKKRPLKMAEPALQKVRIPSVRMEWALRMSNPSVARPLSAWERVNLESGTPGRRYMMKEALCAPCNAFPSLTAFTDFLSLTSP